MRLFFSSTAFASDSRKFNILESQLFPESCLLTIAVSIGDLGAKVSQRGRPFVVHRERSERLKRLRFISHYTENRVIR